MYLICLNLLGKFLQVRLRLLSLMSVSFPRVRLQDWCAVIRMWERFRGSLCTLSGFDCLMLPGWLSAGVRKLMPAGATGLRLI